MAKNEEQNKDNISNVIDKGIIEWVAPEFIYHKRGKTWYMAASTLTLLFVIYGLLSDSPSMSIAFLMLFGIYFLIHNKKPKNIKIVISQLGIKIDDKFYPFTSIKGFYILYNPHQQVSALKLLTSSKVMPEVTIQLANQDPIPVRSYLVRQIPEIEGKEESFLDTVSRIFKL